MLMGDGARAISSGNYARYNLLHGLLSTDGPDLSLTVSARPMEAHTGRVASPWAPNPTTTATSTTRSSDPVGQCTWPKVAWLREAVESLLASERLRGAPERKARSGASLAAPQCTCDASPYRERASTWEPASARRRPRSNAAAGRSVIAPLELPTSDNGVVGAGAHDSFTALSRRGLCSAGATGACTMRTARRASQGRCQCRCRHRPRRPAAAKRWSQKALPERYKRGARC